MFLNPSLCSLLPNKIQTAAVAFSLQVSSAGLTLTFSLVGAETNPESVIIPTLELQKGCSQFKISSLFDDGIEEGGLRATSSLSHNINELDNDKAVDSLQDRVIFLKTLTGDIQEEVESHSRLLYRMGNNMDISRGLISGTMDQFKKA